MRSPPPWFTVTESIPATEPANVTVPDAAARTAVPAGVAKSTPQWPGVASGANGTATGATTGLMKGATHSATATRDEKMPQKRRRRTRVREDP